MLVLLSFVWFLTRDLYQSVYHEHATNARKAAVEHEFENKCSEIVVLDDLRDCFQSVIRSDWDTQRAQEDLKAQKDVAFYALWMLGITTFLGVASLVVAGIGIFYVRETLSATKELSTAENRAWLKIEELNIDPKATFEGGSCTVRVRGHIKNIGKSPAHNVFIRCYGAPANEKDETREARMDRFRKEYDSMKIEIRSGLFPEEPRKLNAGIHFAKNTDETVTTVGETINVNAAVGAVYVSVFYKIVGDINRHETTRAYIVGGLNLSEFKVGKDGPFLVDFIHVSGSTT